MSEPKDKGQPPDTRNVTEEENERKYQTPACVSENNPNKAETKVKKQKQRTGESSRGQG